MSLATLDWLDVGVPVAAILMLIPAVIRLWSTTLLELRLARAKSRVVEAEAEARIFELRIRGQRLAFDLDDPDQAAELLAALSEQDRTESRPAAGATERPEQL